MKSRVIFTLALFSLLALTAATSADARGPLRASAAIWSHGELYGTVGTPAVFTHPPEGTTDTLYNFGMSGLEGQRAISASAPGDQDFNGGRWSVVLVTFTDQGMAALDQDHNGVVDFEFTSEEEVLNYVDLGDLTLTDTDVYFECPLLPGANR
jgi:hypothetical protein